MTKRPRVPAPPGEESDVVTQVHRHWARRRVRNGWDWSRSPSSTLSGVSTGKTPTLVTLTPRAASNCPRSNRTPDRRMDLGQFGTPGGTEQPRLPNEREAPTTTPRGVGPGGVRDDGPRRLHDGHDHRSVRRPGPERLCGAVSASRSRAAGRDRAHQAALLRRERSSDSWHRCRPCVSGSAEPRAAYETTDQRVASDLCVEK